MPAALLLLIACGDSTAPTTYTIDTLPNGAVYVVNTGPALWADTSGWMIVLEAEHTFPFDSTGVFRGEVPSPIGSEENFYWQGDVVLTVEMLEDGGFVLRRYQIRR